MQNISEQSPYGIRPQAHKLLKQPACLAEGRDKSALQTARIYTKFDE